jgi:hypothetical protein
MKFVPFVGEHLREMVFQPAQHLESTFMTPDEAGVLENGMAWTAMDDETVCGVGGLMDVPGWNGQRKIAWCALRPRLGATNLLAITRAVKIVLDACPSRRVEASVKAGFANGQSWARRLGFACEGLMQGYGQDGCDYYLYARVRK